MPTKQTILGLPEDFPIEDATEAIEIIVTEADIKNGKQRSPEQCAFARAERREDAELVRVAALKSVIYLIYNDYAVRYNLSRSAMNAIKAFDDKGGKKMLPGAYSLRPAQSITTRGNSSTRRKSTRTVIRASAWIRGKGPQ